MLLAELTQGAKFLGPSGEEWILTEQWTENPNKINFSLEKIEKKVEAEDELIPD